MTTRPTIITQASAEGEPIIFVERDEHSVAAVQHAAAPSPPSRAITDVFVPGSPLARPTRRRRADVAVSERFVL